MGCLFRCGTLSLLQPPVDWEMLRLTTKRSLTSAYVSGLCYHDNKLYYVESFADRASCTLHMNNIDEQDDVLEQLDKFDFIGPDNRSGTLNRYHTCRPRIDVFTQYVYVPCDKGVLVFSCDDDCLTVRKTLKCVECPLSVAVHSTTTLLVCNAQNICLINVVTDKVIRKFQKPRKEWAKTPTSACVLGETVLVCYDMQTLAKHHIEDAVPALTLQPPEPLDRIYGITTDGHSSFLVTESAYTHGSRGHVYVLDTKGNFRHRINADDSWLLDCALVESELWVACNRDEGSLSVLTAR